MMRFMAMEYFRQSPMLAFPVLALSLFMLVFFIVSMRALLTKRSQFESVSRLPLGSERERAEGESAHG